MKYIEVWAKINFNRVFEQNHGSLLQDHFERLTDLMRHVQIQIQFSPLLGSMK